MGNKYKLLPFITDVISKECFDIHTFADLFAGTGAVSSAFIDKTLITNDILYSNYVSNYAWFGSDSYRKDLIINLITEYNKLNAYSDNYVTESFSDTFFSRDDCSKIGQIRESIETLYSQGEINFRENCILITSLMYGMDKIARTCGHYDAYRKNADFKSSLEMSVLDAKVHNNPLNQCYNVDANILAKDIKADLVYLDPPYNSRQYCDAYHLLENIAAWNKPKVYGMARKMNREDVKSKYCTKEAAIAFKSLIDSINARYIVLSYNNMANKGNDRSNAKISDDEILDILEGRGDVKIYSQNHKSFSTGKSFINDNEERLFVCKVN